MCNKIANTSPIEVYEKRFGVHVHPNARYKPQYHANAFANPGVPVITMKHPEDIQIFEWPLIPHFAKTAADAKKLRVGNVNARCETIFEKPTFRTSINKNRCLIISDGFYESMDVNGVKYPHYIYRKDKEPFAFAGIYSGWKNELGEWIPSCSIITTEPNELMRKIHNIKLRMPVILPPDKERKWLQTDLLNDEIKDLMVPLEDGILTAHPVDNRINKSKEFTNEPWITDVYNYDALTGITY